MVRLRKVQPTPPLLIQRLLQRREDLLAPAGQVPPIAQALHQRGEIPQNHQRYGMVRADKVPEIRRHGGRPGPDGGGIFPTGGQYDAVGTPERIDSEHARRARARGARRACQMHDQRRRKMVEPLDEGARRVRDGVVADRVVEGHGERACLHPVPVFRHRDQVHDTLAQEERLPQLLRRQVVVFVKRVADGVEGHDHDDVGENEALVDVLLGDVEEAIAQAGEGDVLVARGLRGIISFTFWVDVCKVEARERKKTVH